MFDENFYKAVAKILKDKSSTTICIFDKSDFYMAFDKHALFLAKQIFKSTNVIKQVTVGGETGDLKVQYVNINKNQFEKVVKELLLFFQYRVELYRCSNSKNQDWELYLEASPGNLSSFEDILSDTGNMIDSTCVVAIKIQNQNEKLSIAIACCDISNQILKVAEFPDGPRLSALESLLVQISPKECLVCCSDKKVIDVQTLESVLKRVNVVITERKQSDFKSTETVQDLNRLLQFRKGETTNCAAMPQVGLKNAVDCLSALLTYLNLMQDPCNFGKYRLESFVFGQNLRLDAAAVKSLELFDNTFSYATDKNTLFGLLNVCRTSAGKRLLDEWIKMPLLDLNRINDRLDVVEFFAQNTDIRRTMRDDLLNKMDDLPKLLKCFIKKRAGLQEVFKVYQTVMQILQIQRLFLKNDSHRLAVTSMFVKPLEEVFNDFAKYISMVESTLEIIQLQTSNEVRVKCNLNENLHSISSDLDALKLSAEKELSRVARDLNLEADKAVKLESTSQLGYFLRISRKDEKLLRNNKSYEVLEAQKAGVRFSTPKLHSLNDQYFSLSKQYEETQQVIVDEIVTIATGYMDPMQRLNQLLATLDVILCFAEVAMNSKIPYIRPVMLEMGSGVLNLKDARHPSLELQDDVSFISNELYLKKGDCEFIIVTGPNMGGKSTFLRQTALIVLMAQMGCFVPCSSASISVVDAIFTRVGASDCQLKDVSTFMSEMIETASILEAASSNSLIVIDELGRGTSTFDGFGLAYAIAEHIAQNIHSFTLFATHFHELTSLADCVTTVHNFHVTADVKDNQMTLLYKIKPGVCDESFGIHIAEMVDFPKHVIEDAWRKVNEYSSVEPTRKIRAILNDDGLSVNEKADAARLILKELREIR